MVRSRLKEGVVDVVDEDVHVAKRGERIEHHPRVAPPLLERGRGDERIRRPGAPRRVDRPHVGRVRLGDVHQHHAAAARRRLAGERADRVRDATQRRSRERSGDEERRRAVARRAQGGRRASTVERVEAARKERAPLCIHAERLDPLRKNNRRRRKKVPIFQNSCYGRSQRDLCEWSAPREVRDAAVAVDAILAGEKFKFELRQRDPATGALWVRLDTA